MAAGALSDLTALTKTLYGKEKIHNTATRAHPLFNRLRKVGGWVGDGNYRLPIITSNPQGISADLTKAQANATTTKQKQWVLTQADKYAVVNLNAKVMTMAKTDEGAFLDAFKLQVDGMLEQFGADLARDIYGSGSGSIGRRGSIAGSVITLSTADDVRNFYEGMSLKAGPNDSSAGLRAGGTDPMVVTNVDWDAGTVTVSGTVTGFVDNDYLFREGDASACLTGLKGWLPAAAPGATLFFNVDRTSNIAALSGWRKDASNESLEDALLVISAKAKRMNANTTAIYANPLVVANMMKKAGSKVFRDQGGEVKLGFTGIKALLLSGIADVVADPDCPPDLVYGLDESTLHVKYAGKGFPHFVEEDDLMWLRASNADSFEMRIRSWGQLGCSCPGRNFVVQVNSQYQS